MKTIDRFTFRMPDDVKTDVEKIAKHKGYPMNALILQWTCKGVKEFYKK